jgi:hypothetical protein
MRLTPSQIGMLQLLGEQLPREPEPTLPGRIQFGHDFLMQITGEDFGFDPQRWHEYLRETDAGGYRWSNKHLGMAKRIALALSNPEWCAAVKKLEGSA